MKRASISDLTPETLLLLACARTQLNPDQAEICRRLISAELNWDVVLRQARRHRVANLIYTNLRTNFQDQIPEPIADAFNVHHQSVLFGNLALTSELYRLLDALSNQSVAVIPYKGPILTQEIYSDLGRREYSDLDLVVTEKDIELADHIIQGMGYIRTWPEPQISSERKSTHLRQKYNYRYLHPESGTTLELHWNVLPGYFSNPKTPGWFWDSTRTLKIAGREILTFKPETYLILLCAHGANHCWLYHLNLVSDIGDYIRRYPSLDWSEVIQTSQEAGLKKSVRLGLWLAHELLDPDLPAAVLEWISQDKKIEQIGIRTVNLLLKNKAPTGFYVPRFQLALSDSWKARMRYLLSLLEPSERDIGRLSLPPALFWLYYLLRPFRLLREHAVHPTGQN